MAAQIDPKALKRIRRLNDAIQFHNNELVQKLLDEGIDVNAFDKDIEPGDGLGETNLNVAIMSANQWAFDELLKRGANIRQLGGSRREPLIMAASQSNEDMVTTLLNKGVPPNVYSSDNAIGYAISTISGYALEKFGRWSFGDKPANIDDPNLHQNISHFYHQDKNYKIASTKGAKPIPFHNDHDKKPIRVYLKGNLSLIGLLLDRGVSPSTFCGDRNILMILENPNKYHNSFTFEKGIEYIGGEGNLVTLKFQFSNHSYECPFEVLVDYDLTEIQALVLGHHKAHQNDRSDTHWQGVAEAIGHKLKDELSEDVHKKVHGIETKVQDESKKNAEHRQQVAPLLAQHLAEADIKLREEAIAKHALAERVRAKFATVLNVATSSSIILSGGKIESAHNNTHNKVGKVFEFMGPHIPFIGPLITLAGKGLKFYGDKDEETTCKHIASFFGGDLALAAKFTQKLAIRLTERCEFLQHLSLSPKEVDKLADNLVTQVCLSILGMMEERICYATSSNKDKIEEDIVTTIIVATIGGNKTLKHYFDMYEKFKASHPSLIVVAHEHKKDEAKGKRSSDYKTDASTVTAAVLATGAEVVSSLLLAQGYAKFKAATK